MIFDKNIKINFLIQKKYLIKNNKEFIKFILDNYPYKGYEDDKKEKKINFSDELELIKFLREKYVVDEYEYEYNNEESQLNYFIVELIESYFNKIFERVQ